MNRLFLLLFMAIMVCICGCSYAYNYESTLEIPIEFRIQNDILSEKSVYEGEKINFVVEKDLFYDKHYLAKKGDVFTAEVQAVITSGMNGIPASIIFNNFHINEIPPSKLTSSFEVFGQDRSLWVFPLKWALTPLPPTGSLTNFIKGGKAKVKKDKLFTIYYHPEW